MQQKTIELCNSSCALEENRQRHIFTGELLVNASPNHGYLLNKRVTTTLSKQLFETESANLGVIITLSCFILVCNKFISVQREMNHLHKR